MFGVVSHYIADISWHGLAQTPYNYGMIETMGGIDFNCTGLCSTAHTAADTGGEFIASYATSLAWDDPNAWYIPTQDLVNIYAMANRTVNGSDIDQCAVTFYAGSWAIRLLGSLIEPLEIGGAPTFAEHFLDLPLGGIDDMAVWTGRLWLRWADWLDNGPPSIFPDGPGIDADEPLPSLAAKGKGKNKAKTLARAAAASSRDVQHDESHRQESHGHMSESAQLYKALLRTLAPLVAEAQDKGGLGLVSAEKDQQSGSMTMAMAMSSASTGQDPALAFAQVLLSLLQQPVDEETVPLPRHTPVPGESWTSQPSGQALSDTHPALLAGRILAVLRGAGRGASLSKLRSHLASIKERLSQQAGHTSPSSSASVSVSDVELVRALLLLGIEATQAKTKANTTASALSSALGNSSTVIGSPIGALASSIPLEYLGSSLAAGDFNGDGKGDLAIGAFGHTWHAGDGSAHLLPQSGGFYVQYGPVNAPPANGSDFPVLPAPSAATLSTEVYARLGWSACTLDFNLDGVDDLAVSAPAQGWAWNVSQPPWQADFYYWGAVHVYFGSPSGLATTAQPNVLITTTVNETHTGLHLTCADISGDGRPDLLIGSPMAATNGPAGSTYAAEDGRVDVFFASGAYQVAGQGSQVTLDLYQAANLTSNGTSVDAWFGYAMDTWANVTLPAAQVLARAALAQQPTLLTGIEGKLSSSDAATATQAAAAALEPFMAAEHPCAEAVAAVSLDANASATVLFVGAPGHRAAPSYAAVGRVYAFAIPAVTASDALWTAFQCISSGTAGSVGSPALLPIPLFTITGDASLNTLGPLVSSKIGAGLAVGHPLTHAASTIGGIGYLAIGVPVTDGMNSSNSLGMPTAGGAVVIFTLNPASPPVGSLTWTAASSPAYSRAVLYSSLPDARFGWHVDWADANGDGYQDLVVAAPMYTPIFIASTDANQVFTDRSMRASGSASLALDRLASDTTGHESGAVLIYRGGAGLISGTVTDADQAANWRANGDQEWGRFGHSFVFADWDGDGRAELIVAASRAAEVVPPAATATAEMPGAVYAFRPAF